MLNIYLCIECLLGMQIMYYNEIYNQRVLKNEKKNTKHYANKFVVQNI